MAKKKSVAVGASENYFVSDSELSLRTIQREVTQFSIRHNIDLIAMRDQMQMRHFMEEAGRYMALELSTRIATKKFAAKTVRFPSDWWQAFKLRFFPAKALKRWPVIFTDITLEASAYHPDVSIPDHATYVEIMMRADESYRH